MQSFTLIGILAGSCTTLAFLPQAVKAWRSRSTRDLSLSMFLIFVTGVLLWLTYGLMIGDLPIILANSMTLLLAGLILLCKLIYR
ncbi:SemiSWEET transporter [Limibacillus halophilus]|uniref:MtN3 and saliva related transmembrane protein n=1 Tax=Limibacillus halophilus TaxID=1579333 RepID=A0A839SUY8_9PROT|nr:SemiSWEET transporter [Limibacillus halophilus]MBB3066611.1 MtN3 and saliva related transmembrane protein [Limibacillus halophilus]